MPLRITVFTYEYEHPKTRLIGMTKLVQFYENYLSHTYGDVHSIVISSVDCKNPLMWIDEVRRCYSPSTLTRLLRSSDVETRRSATWAYRSRTPQPQSPSSAMPTSHRKPRTSRGHRSCLRPHRTRWGLRTRSRSLPSSSCVDK